MKDFAFMLAQADSANSGQPAAPAPAQAPSDQTATKTVQPGSQAPPAGEKKKPGFFDSIMFPMMLILIVVYFFMMRGPKKRQQQHKQMLDNLKKNDRIRTVGGIIGTVVDVRDDSIVIKVDESNNTKMKIVRSAIGHVYTDEEAQS